MRLLHKYALITSTSTLFTPEKNIYTSQPVYWSTIIVHILLCIPPLSYLSCNFVFFICIFIQYIALYTLYSLVIKEIKTIHSIH